VVLKPRKKKREENCARRKKGERFGFQLLVSRAKKKGEKRER